VQMTRPSKEEIEQARRDAPDYKAKEDAAYMKSLRTTEPAPAPAPTVTPEKVPAKKMAKGGYVRAADGIAQRGKTRGRLV